MWRRQKDDENDHDHDDQSPSREFYDDPDVSELDLYDLAKK